MYKSPFFLSNLSPSGLPQICSNSGANGRTQPDLENHTTNLIKFIRKCKYKYELDDI